MKASLWSPGSGCRVVLAGAAVLLGCEASPVQAGETTWGGESWDTEHPPGPGSTRWRCHQRLSMFSLCTGDGQHLHHGHYKNGLEQTCCLYLQWKGFIYIHPLLLTGMEVIFRQVREGGDAGLSPWRCGGDQDMGRGRQEYNWGWDTMGLNWGTSQKEREYNRRSVAGHWFDSDTSIETTFA